MLNDRIIVIDIDETVWYAGGVNAFWTEKKWNEKKKIAGSKPFRRLYIYSTCTLFYLLYTKCQIYFEPIIIGWTKQTTE